MNNEEVTAVELNLGQLIELRNEANAQKMRSHNNDALHTGKVIVDAEVLLELLDSYRVEVEVE